MTRWDRPIAEKWHLIGTEAGRKIGLLRVRDRSPVEENMPGRKALGMRSTCGELSLFTKASYQSLPFLCALFFRFHW
jgi:hypothetical protein